MIQFNAKTIIAHFGEANSLLIPVPEGTIVAACPTVQADGVVEVFLLKPIDESDTIYQVSIVFATAEAQVAFLMQCDCEFRVVATSEIGLVCNAAGAVTCSNERLLH